jgi:ribose 5-phosphate isomerase RpiB
MADIFVSTPFSGEERHVRRVSKLIELDKYLEKK